MYVCVCVLRGCGWQGGGRTGGLVVTVPRRVAGGPGFDVWASALDDGSGTSRKATSR